MAYGIIYKIENLKNGKVYIGITTSKRGFDGRYSARGVGIERVYNFYKYQKKNKQFVNVHLLNSIEKYGFDSFSIDKCFDVAETKSELLEKEKKWISFYNSNNLNKGYNRTAGGDSFLSGKDNPRYNSVERVCKTCGKTFLIGEGRLKTGQGIYCSRKCAGVGTSLNNRGKNNPVWCSVPIKCDYCGKEILKPPSLINKTNYCDRYCQAKAYETRFSGCENPNFGNNKVSGSKNGRARSIVCVNTGEEFSYAKQASIKYGISYTGIVSTLTGNQKTAGVHPDTGEKLKWKYKD